MRGAPPRFEFGRSKGGKTLELTNFPPLVRYGTGRG